MKWRTERSGLVQRSVVRREADGFMEKKNEGFAQKRVGTVAMFSFCMLLSSIACPNFKISYA